MATIMQGAAVTLNHQAMQALRFPPPSSDLVIVVHHAALRAPGDRHTQVAHLVGGAPDWMGALGEDLLGPSSLPVDTTARSACGRCLLTGGRMWDILRPGALVQPGVARPMSTVYDGSDLRPWVVVGETAAGDLVAAPLNDAQQNPKWWTPVIAQMDMNFPGNNKDGQVELAHLWTLPGTLAADGCVEVAGRPAVEAAVRNYFNL